jgi:hypothetical protein
LSMSENQAIELFQKYGSIRRVIENYQVKWILYYLKSP